MDGIVPAFRPGTRQGTEQTVIRDEVRRVLRSVCEGRELASLDVRSKDLRHAALLGKKAPEI